MEQVNIGVIGCGVIGQHHLKALAANPRARIAAVCDVQEESARASAANFGIQRWTTKADELLTDPEIDGVVLALPTCYRTQLALEALRQGKHVLTEKPVAMNAAEVESLMAVRGDRVVACCSSRMSLMHSARAAAQCVASGRLGEIRVIHCRAVLGLGKAPATPPPAWRLSRKLNGGGILVNWGSYEMDFLFSILGWSLEPVEVCAQTWNLPPELSHYAAPGSDAESHVVAMVRFADRSVFHYERGESCSTIRQESWQIIGSKATLRLHLINGNAEVFIDESDPREGIKTHVLFLDKEEQKSVHAHPPDDFVEAIIEKRAPATGLEEALLIARITDAIYASSSTGRSVSPVKPT